MDKYIIPVDVEDIVSVLTVVLLICRAFVVEEMLFFGDSVIAVNVGAVDLKVIKTYTYLQYVLCCYIIYISNKQGGKKP